MKMITRTTPSISNYNQRSNSWSVSGFRSGSVLYFVNRALSWRIYQNRSRSFSGNFFDSCSFCEIMTFPGFDEISDWFMKMIMRTSSLMLDSSDSWAIRRYSFSRMNFSFSMSWSRHARNSTSSTFSIHSNGWPRFLWLLVQITMFQHVNVF